MTDGARVKGSVVKARLELLKQRSAFEKVMAVLPPEDQKIWRGLVLAVTWYPFDAAQRLDEGMAKVLGHGDELKFYNEIGRSSADANLASVHKAYVRVGDPHHLLSCTAPIYQQYYDRGYRTYEKSSETSCVLKTFEAEAPSRNDCQTVMGWHERAVELCGGKNVVVTEPLCRSRGGPHCEYHISWTL